MFLPLRFFPSFHIGLVVVFLLTIPSTPVCAMEGDSAVSEVVLTSGTARLPFALRKPSAVEVRDVQTVWAGALLAYRAGHFAEAARRLRAIQPSERLAQLYRTVFFAEACLEAGLRHDADSALEVTLRWVHGSLWQNELYRLRLKAFDAKAETPVARRDFYFEALKAPLDARLKVEFLYQLRTLDSSFLPQSERIAILRQLLRDAPPDSLLDGVYRSFAANRTPCCGGSPGDQKLLMEFEEKLGYLEKAEERGTALLAGMPAGSQRQDLELELANLSLRKGVYAEAIKRYLQYEKTYGGTPELYLQLARASRKLSDEAGAQRFYSRLVDEYPKNPKAADVYWMRAFDAETAGRTDSAVETYSRLIREFPDIPNAERAAFRVGLTHYKHRDFDLALRAFQNLRRLKPSSRAVPAGIYWEARSLESRGDSAAALKTWIEVVFRFPFSFYGHLARFTLRSRNAWPDSLDWNRRFPPSGAPEVKSWFASHVSGFHDLIDSSGESDYLPISLLLQWQMDSLALFTLRSQSAAFLSNPWALYIAGRQCQDAGLWTEAFRFGTLLGNLLPIEEWPQVPRSVLRLLYPPAYREAVQTWAVRDGLPSGLVFALMKQESGFDAGALSRVGARGLMQMMPATGALQAKRDDVPGFTPDALFIPEVNIRLGVAYLRDIEKRYEGNLYFTLAHYNAGPEALAGWMPQLTGKPIDEAVEDIGYSETRDYVKRVLSNYWTYRALDE